MSDLIRWSTATVKPHRHYGFVLYLDHMLERRRLAAFIDTANRWLDQDDQSGTVQIREYEPASIRTSVDGRVHSQPGRIEVSGKGLLTYDARYLADWLQREAERADEDVRRQMVLEEQQIAPWVERLRSR